MNPLLELHVVVHANVKVPSPLAVHTNSMSLPTSATVLCGGTEITGGSTEWKEGACIIYMQHEMWVDNC